ncbi:MFS transporter [Paludisphaera mucosa]|uniref:MFS transporter n=1 Tax=Paludisphaera mucosa TaxID=3030827 RepID=A0ABT6F683_9BACT|nr:MFS transporter [Paludisphaera mucosa]MDG3003102.1 MFS transporter [Paludisphaera mucosa]
MGMEAQAVGEEAKPIRRAVNPEEVRTEVPLDDLRVQMRRELILVLMLASVQFTSIVDFMIVMPLGPQLMRVLGLTPDQFGRIVSSYTVAAGIAGFVASFVMDRFGRKTAFLTLYAGFLLGTLLCGLAWNYPTLLAARLATGVFGGILGGLALAIVGDAVPESRRGRATGVLMSAFAIASVVGIPVGLKLGTAFGWQIPFLVLAGLGLPTLFVALKVLPPLRAHIRRGESTSVWRKAVEMFAHANHIRAFALTVAIMFGGFTVIPYISAYLVRNCGFREGDLSWVFVSGGLLTLIGAPLIGRAADRFGKLRVFRIVASVTIVLLIAITNLGVVPIWVASAVFGCLMLGNAGRMVPAMAMVTASVEPSQRGGFMSANSAVQHLAAGMAAYVGGLILREAPDGSLLQFDRVGYFAAAFTVVSLWLAGRLRSASPSSSAAEVQSASSL